MIILSISDLYGSLIISDLKYQKTRRTWDELTRRHSSRLTDRFRPMIVIPRIPETTKGDYAEADAHGDMQRETGSFGGSAVEGRLEGVAVQSFVRRCEDEA